MLPLFALANAGIQLSSGSISAAASSPVAIGIVVGLLIGKPVGIFLLTFVGVKVLGGSLPVGISLRVVAAGSLLCSIGFTVSLFISDLAFESPSLTDEAKAGVLAASAIAGVAGALILRLALKPSAEPALQPDR